MTVLALAGATVLVTPSAASAAEQVPIPLTTSEVPGPAAGNTMTADYVQMVGRMAYVWGYAMVNAHNRRAAFAEVPEPGLLGGVVPMAPVGYNSMLTNYVAADQHFIVTPNQDVVYGAGFTALDKEPTVFQVPDFGDRFWVYPLYDQRTDEIGQFGQQYGTEPGFYMIVGRDWQGEVPQGIKGVVRSSTASVFCVPRIFKDATPEDTAAVQPLLNQVLFYPLSEYDGQMKTKDWSKIPHFPAPKEAGAGEHKWVTPETYFDELPVVMKEVSPLPGEEALYEWIASVWAAADKDPATKQALVASFVAADKELVGPLLSYQYNGRDMGRGWTVPVNAAQWGTDYLNRTAVSKAAMYENTPAETQYQGKVADSTGAVLDGNNQYTITFPKGETPPVKGFWSLTMYNAEHFFNPNPLGAYSRGTKDKDMQYGEDGSLTLYLGATSPGKDKESNWLPAPAGTFSLLLRTYWPDQAVIDGTWLPPDVVKVN